MQPPPPRPRIGLAARRHPTAVRPPGGQVGQEGQHHVGARAVQGEPGDESRVRLRSRLGLVGEEVVRADAKPAGEAVEERERLPLPVGHRQKEVSGRAGREAGGKEGEAAAIARDDRELLASERPEPPLRHPGRFEPGQKAVRANCPVDVGDVAAKLLKELAAGRGGAAVRHLFFPSLA